MTIYYKKILYIITLNNILFKSKNGKEKINLKIIVFIFDQ